MTEPVAVGIVGLGTIARTHIEVLATRSDVSLAFTVDKDAERRRTFHREGCPCYETLGDALNRHEPSVIVVATPTATHADITRVALTGSDARVLVEKPLVHDRAALAQIRSLCHNAQLRSRVSVAHHFAFAPEVTWAARQIGQNPSWGPPTRITAAFHDPYIARADHAFASYVSSWTDSGPNQLSVLARFVPLDATQITAHSDDGSRSWSTVRLPTGTARLSTSWRAIASSKRSTIELGHSGTEIWLDHTAVTGFVMQGDELVSTLDNDGRTPRKVAHYAPLYESLLGPAPDPILSFETAARIVELL